MKQLPPCKDCLKLAMCRNRTYLKVRNFKGVPKYLPKLEYIQIPEKSLKAIGFKRIEPYADSM